MTVWIVEFHICLITTSSIVYEHKETFWKQRKINFITELIQKKYMENETQQELIDSIKSHAIEVEWPD